MALYSPATVSALALSVVSGAIATGIGVALPRFEAVNVSRSTKAIVPSAFAFVIYSVTILVVALPTVIAHSGIVSHALASFLGVDQFLLGIGGTLVSVVLGCVVGVISTYMARNRIRDYRLG